MFTEKELNLIIQKLTDTLTNVYGQKGQSELALGNRIQNLIERTQGLMS